jgi:hypothetical protein
MKRKYTEGIENLTNLVKNFSMGEFLKPLIYTYRSYGYFCVGKHQKAFNDLVYVEENYKEKFEVASQYNKLICEGIIKSNLNDFENSINLFNLASKLNPKRMEPYFYKSMVLIKFCSKLIPSQD